MRVLLMAEDDGLFARGAETLHDAGHEVLGCHEAGSAADRWPCTGVTDECPLESGVDAAVALRRSNTSRVEAGVSCVVRQKVPLVVAGAGDMGLADGIAPYAAAMVDGVGDELTRALETVNAAPINDLSAAATEAIIDTAARLGLHGEFSAEVHRDRRRIRLDIHTTTALDPAARSVLGQAGFAPVRDLLPGGAADTIDVSFAER